MYLVKNVELFFLTVWNRVKIKAMLQEDYLGAISLDQGRLKEKKTTTFKYNFLVD